MNVSAASIRTSSQIDANMSVGPAPESSCEPDPAPAGEAPIVLERVSLAKSPFVQAYAPHQLGSSGAPSYPRELNDKLGDDYKQACGTALHVLTALAHPPAAVHAGVALGGHRLTDVVCLDAAPVQIADR